MHKRTTPIMVLSGTSLPLSMYALASFPTSVPAVTAARSMSPVDKCTTPNLSRIFSHCVPLPLAGAPAITILGAAKRDVEEEELRADALVLTINTSTRLSCDGLSDVREAPVDVSKALRTPDCTPNAGLHADDGWRNPSMPRHSRANATQKSRIFIMEALAGRLSLFWIRLRTANSYSCYVTNLDRLDDANGYPFGWDSQARST